MAIHKVIEVISQSETSWEDAAQRAVSDAGRTIEQIKSIWIKNFEGVVRDNKIVVPRQRERHVRGRVALRGPDLDLRSRMRQRRGHAQQPVAVIGRHAGRVDASGNS